MSLRSRLSPNRSFHSTLSTLISLSSLPPSPECSLHILYSLPPSAFVDPYELAHYSQQYAFHYDAGTKNLELPVMAVDQSFDGSLLLDVALPDQDAGETQNLEFEVQVPLHFRYGEPNENRDGDENDASISARIPPPTGFIACPRIETPSQRPIPFPHALPPSWTFFQTKDIILLLDSAPSLSESETGSEADPLTFTIPVGRAADIAQVEIGTALIIILCFFYLVRVALKTRRRLNERAAAIEALARSKRQ